MRYFKDKWHRFKREDLVKITCDRCGKVLMTNAKTTVWRKTLYIRHYDVSDTYEERFEVSLDLCNECDDKLEKFIKRGKKR